MNFLVPLTQMLTADWQFTNSSSIASSALLQRHSALSYCQSCSWCCRYRSCWRASWRVCSRASAVESRCRLPLSCQLRYNTASLAFCASVPGSLCYSSPWSHASEKYVKSWRFGQAGQCRRRRRWRGHWRPPCNSYWFTSSCQRQSYSFRMCLVVLGPE